MRFNIHSIRTVALAASLLLVGKLVAQSEVYSFHIETPIPVTNQDGQKVMLVGMQGNSVTFQLGAVGEASIPIDEESKIKFIYPYPANFSDIQFNILNGNYAHALAQMPEPPIDLLRFLAVPEPNCNFHLYCELYYRALSFAGRPEESVKATAAIPWQSTNVPPAFFQHASTLLNRMVGEQEIEASRQLLATLQERLTIDQFAKLSLPIADKLRLINENELVESIYDALSQSSDPEIRGLGRMWTAYNYANTGRLDEAKKLLQEIGEIGEESPLFPVYCLANGRLALSEQNSVPALRYLSRAMVRTSIADSYKPEIYFLMIQSYMLVENKVPARRLAKEMAVFYPTNMWRQSIVERYPKLEEEIESELPVTTDGEI